MAFVPTNLLIRSSHVYGETFVGGSNHAGRWEVRVLTVQAKCLNVGTAGANSEPEGTSWVGAGSLWGYTDVVRSSIVRVRLLCEWRKRLAQEREPCLHVTLPSPEHLLKLPITCYVCVQPQSDSYKV